MTTLEDDILTIEYNEPIFNAEGLILSEPEQFIVDELNSCVKIRLDDRSRDIDFIHDDDYLNYYNTKSQLFLLSYVKIHMILEDKYNYNYQQIKELSKNVLLKTFKYRVTTIGNHGQYFNDN